MVLHSGSSQTNWGICGSGRFENSSLEFLGFFFERLDINNSRAGIPLCGG